MDELCEMIGLEKVKRRAIGFFEIFMKVRHFPAELRDQLGQKSLNFAFLGNPGTGSFFFFFSVFNIPFFFVSFFFDDCYL